MKVKKGKAGTGKENKVCKLKVETFSLLISILIHLGLLAVPFSLSPPEPAKYSKSIKVDYIISLPKINHHLRESSGKSILSPLTLVSGRKNKKLLKPSLILTKKPSISSNLRSQEGILSPQEASSSRKRESLSLSSSPIKGAVPIPESNSPREGTSKMISNIRGVNLSIDKATISSSSSPLTQMEESSLLRKIEGSVYLAKEENLSQKRLANHTPSLATEPVGLNQTLALRQREYLLLPTEKNCYPYQILSSSLDPIVQLRIRGYSPIMKEKKFSTLTTEPDFHREEIRILKEGTGLLTESLWLREYGEKIRKLINTNKKYPPVARQRGWEGRIKVRFTINPSGKVIKTEVFSPCTYEVLNRAAEKLIKDTSPFPPFPASWHKDSLSLEVQVVYQLEETTLTKENGN
jgi:TonB family protein